jgi:hypothetical protein
MAAIDQMTQMTPGSATTPGAIYNLASQDVIKNYSGAQTLPGQVQTNDGTTTAQVDPATGQTVTPTPIDPTVIPDPNTLTA